jgi:hypothetical protein
MPKDYGEPTFEVIAPDGRRKVVMQSDLPRARAEGFELDPEQTVVAQTVSGERPIAAGDLPSLERSSIRYDLQDRSALHRLGEEARMRREYGDSELAALGLGAARGLTFGLSDIAAGGLLGEEYVRGVQEYNPVASGVGEFGAILGTALFAPGSSLLRMTPAGAVSAKTAEMGAKSAKAYIAAEALEGAAYGVGQGISNLALQNEPLTAEGIASELFTDGVVGGVFGGVGGAAFKGAEKLVGKLRKAEPPMPDVFDVTTPEGLEFMGRTSRHLEESYKIGDEILDRTSPTAWKRLSDDEVEVFSDWAEYTRKDIGDVVGSATRKADELDADIANLESMLAKRPKAEAPRTEDFVEWNLPNRGHMQDVRAMVEETEVARDMLSGMVSAKHAEELSDAAISARNAIQEGYEIVPGGYPGVKPFETDWERIKNKGFGAARKPKAHEDFEAREQARKAWKTLWDPVVEYRKAVNRIADIAGAGKVVEDLPLDPSVMFRMRTNKAAYDEALRKASPLAEPKELAQMRDVAKQLRENIDALKVHGGNLKATDEAYQAASVLGDDFADTMVATRKLLGESDESIQQFVDDMSLLARISDDISGRTPPVLDEAAGVARESLTRATASMRKFFGNTPTPATMGKVLNGTPEEISQAFASISEYRTALANLAKSTADPKLVADAQAAIKRFDDIVAQSVPEDIVQKASGIGMSELFAAGGLADIAIPGVGLFETDTPLDEVAKAALVFSLLRKGGKANQAVEAVTGGASKRTKGFLDYMAGRGASSVAQGYMPQAKGAAGRFARGAAGAAAYKTGFAGMDKFLSARGLMQASGRSKSRIMQAVADLGKKAARKSAQGGVGAVAALKALRLLDEREEASQRESDSLRELYKLRSEQVRRLASNPQALAMHFHELTTPLREQHPTLGDKVEVAMTRGVQHLADTLPRDPGTAHVMGMSTWEPDSVEMYKFAERVKVMFDPVSAVRGVKDGTISQSGAQALRTIYPEIFAEVQRQIAENLEQIRENTTYDEQNRLSILAGVPVNSSNSPEYVQFVMQQYAARAQQNQPQPQASGPLPSEQPTKAQELSSRGLE